MSDWITDRRPMHEDDGTMVYGPDGNICHWTCIKNGDAWKPIPKCEPYVKPKRCKLSYDKRVGCYVIDVGNVWRVVLYGLHYINSHREAAERIAAIFEEVMP